MHTVNESLDLIAEVKPGLRPDPDAELIKSGLLDSVDIMSLVLALDNTFDIEITPMELREENFRSAETILTMVHELEEA